MHKLKLLVGVLLVFVLGALAGAIGTGHVFKNRMAEFARGGPPGGPPGGKVFRKILDDLDLTAHQKDTLDSIVDETEAKLLALQRKYHPEFLGIFDESILLMKEQLDDRQRNELDKHLEKMRRGLSRGFVERTAHEDQILKDIFSESKTQLNLTHDQQAKIRKILEEGSKQKKKIVQKYSEQLPRSIPFFMEEIRSQEKSMERNLRAVLTPEQMETFKKLRDKRMEDRHMGPPPPL